MKLSENNRKRLMQSIHEYINEYSAVGINSVFSKKDFYSLTYPPNIEFSDEEKKELLKIETNTHLNSALRKVLADNAAAVVFSIFNLIDGTTDPDGGNDWTGIKLVDDNDIIEEGDYFLHDEFYDTYWDWKAN